MKKEFEAPKIEIIVFTTEDIMKDSGTPGPSVGEDQLPWG